MVDAQPEPHSMFHCCIALPSAHPHPYPPVPMVDAHAMGASVVSIVSSRLSLFLSLNQDRSVMLEAQRVCSAGIEEASRVGSALESGARSSCHGQYEAVLAASSRALEIAPQCTAAQEMRVRRTRAHTEIEREADVLVSTDRMTGI